MENALRASTPISPANAHTNAALANFAAAYSNRQFIADLICPVILTEKMSDSFYKRLRTDVATSLSNLVGARGKLSEATYGIETGSFTCRGYGLKNPVSVQLQGNADPAISPKEWAVQNVMQRNMLAREIRVSALVGTTGSWASANTGAAGAVWSDETSGAPLDDIHTAIEAIPSDGEDSLLVGVCSTEVFHALRRHPQIREMHGTGTGQLTREMLASYLELDMLHVSRVEKQTANTGATASYSRVWSATQFAIVKTPRQMVSTEQECFGVTFRHKSDGAPDGILVREWHEADEGTEGVDYVAVTHKDDEVVVQNDQGYLITSVLS